MEARMFDLPYLVTHPLAGSIYKRHAELMIAAETMTGIENHKVMALAYDPLRAVLKRYNRVTDQ
jgi:hypothetical protein